MCPIDRPLLLLDIDGVISLFGFDPMRRPRGRFASVDGIPHFLSAEAAESVLGLTDLFELVWCSGWEEKADEHLPFALGLPGGLHHLAFAGAAGERDASPGAGGSTGRHWKLDAIDAHAGTRRPLAWVDDGHDETCRAWAAARAAPTLLISTDPATGLTVTHAAQLRAWAESLPGR